MTERAEKNEDILDKTLIYIDSSNSSFIGSTGFEFNFDLSDPIKNALYVMNVRSEIILNPTDTINGNVIQDGDPIFIQFRDYYRLVSNINGKNVKCFDYISLNLTDKFGSGSIPNKDIIFKSENTSTNCCQNDINTYVINPIEPNFKRIDIHLYDKYYNIIPRQNIKKFTMIVCVYYNRKKITQF